MNARKTNRRSLAMLLVLVAITVLGDIVGLIVHYSLHPVVGRDMPITHDGLTKEAASSDLMSRSD